MTVPTELIYLQQEIEALREDNESLQGRLNRYRDRTRAASHLIDAWAELENAMEKFKEVAERD